MASLPLELHSVLIPLMVQGHMIPMVDIARMLAQRGVTVTIITTPLNAGRLRSVLGRAREAKLDIKVVEIRFLSTEVGLPEGCENIDMLPSVDLGLKFMLATSMLQEPVEKVLHELKPKPSCLLSDNGFSWTTDLGQKLCIPRIIFHGPGCFSLLCIHSLINSGILNRISSDSEHFVIPGLPDRVEVTKPQVAGVVGGGSTSKSDLRQKIIDAEKGAYGIVVNSFQELELQYAEEYAKVKGKKVWCIGPVSLCNTENADMAERGNKTAIDGHFCLDWLNMWESKSVVYVCLGTLSRLSTAQMIELGLGLELSDRPFIWCIRHKSEELERWLSDENFEERVSKRGLVVHGWALQVLILSHAAVGGFLTHCGWNSTLEGICADVPMVTWPHFADQFLNEKFIVEVLMVGVRIGIDSPFYSERKRRWKFR